MDEKTLFDENKKEKKKGRIPNIKLNFLTKENIFNKIFKLLFYISAIFQLIIFISLIYFQSPIAIFPLITVIILFYLYKKR